MTREQGIQAIIALQAFVGIVETREQAERGWDAMDERERKQTEFAVAFFLSPEASAA